VGGPSPPASVAVVALAAVLAESSYVPPDVVPVVVVRIAAPTGYRLLQHALRPVHPWSRSGSSQISESGRHDLLQPKIPKFDFSQLAISDIMSYLLVF